MARPTLGMLKARQDPTLLEELAALRALLVRRGDEIARRDERIQRVRTPADRRITRLEERLTATLVRLFALCDANWADLAGTAKSFSAGGMVVKREPTDAKIGVDSRQQEQLIATLRELGLADCIQTVEVVNTTALLAHLDQVRELAGVQYTPADFSFGVKPSNGKGWTGRVSELAAMAARLKQRSGSGKGVQRKRAR